MVRFCHSEEEGRNIRIINIYICIFIKTFVDKLSPDLKYGKIENNTEIIVSPHKPHVNGTNESDTNVIIDEADDESIAPQEGIEEEVIEAVPVGKVNGVKTSTPEDHDRLSLAERLALRRKAAEKSPSKSPSFTSPKFSKSPPKETPKKKTTPLPKRKASPTQQKASSTKRTSSPVPIITLPPDSEDGSSSSGSSTEDDSTTNDGSSVAFSNFSVSQSVKFDIQNKRFNNMKNELQEQQKKNYQFRVIPTKWTHDTQMCDVYLTPHNKPNWLDLRQIYVISCLVNSDSDDRSSDDRVMKDFYVKIKLKHETEDSPKNIYPTIEVNDLLMAHLNLRKIDRLTLVPKKTVLNFIEKIELYPSNYNGYDLETIVESFKRLFVSSTRLYPTLINQDQIFKLCDGSVIATVKIYPETFRYCLCDSEILRENKVIGMEQVKDVSATIQAADKILDETSEDDLFDGVEDKNLVDLDLFETIVSDCTQSAILNLCLNEHNKFRKMSNAIIIG